MLITLLWVSWLAYWFIAAHNTKQTRRKEPLLSRLEHMVPLLVAVALYYLPESSSWLFQHFMPSGLVLYWLGVALLVVGLLFTVWARVHLGTNWSGTVTVKQDHELVRTGPYALVRHPIYTGLLLGFVGTAIALGEWRGIVSLVLVAAAFIYKIQTEERFMIETFGAAYVDYRQKTRALIPFLF